VERQPPSTASDEIDLYLRTYYSLLRSSGPVRVRAFEEAHIYCNSSLHLGARDPWPDVAAFAYSAARLPECMPWVARLVLGQSHESFEAVGLPVMEWQAARARGRRRPLRWDGAGTLAVFVTSTSDIDDLVPIVTAWQVEWNKMHRRLREGGIDRRLDRGEAVADDELAPLLAPGGELPLLRAAFGAEWERGLREMARRESDVSLQLLNGSLSQYQRAAQRWWGGIEPSYVREERPRRRPVYFVSSNTHSLTNLAGGYAHAHRDELIAFARARNPEGLAPAIDAALASGDENALANLLYYLMRLHLHASGPEQLAAVQAFDAESGIVSIESPGKIDVGAQVFELARLRPERLDPRARVEGVERLAASEAVIINIDYPLGLAAYHHLARVGQGVGELRGVYIMGKAATLNGRVGDVLISTVAHDEHSKTTYLFRNAFAAADVQPWLREPSVFDNQKALSVRGTFLQNRDYMSVFYREGYTVIEMEAGPFLSAVYEMVYPNRHPDDQIVHLSNVTPFDVGLLHYASDTPYSRRQSLLSKSMSFFGVEATYGCAIAILRRILQTEIARLN
jgi:hypothetical protein